MNARKTNILIKKKIIAILNSEGFVELERISAVIALEEGYKRETVKGIIKDMEDAGLIINDDGTLKLDKV